MLLRCADRRISASEKVAEAEEKLEETSTTYVQVGLAGVMAMLRWKSVLLQPMVRSARKRGVGVWRCWCCRTDGRRLVLA